MVFVQLFSCVWLWPHGLQHTRLPCPSPSPRACSISCPLSWSCHPTISAFCAFLSILLLLLISTLISLWSLNSYLLSVFKNFLYFPLSWYSQFYRFLYLFKENNWDSSILRVSIESSMLISMLRSSVTFLIFVVCFFCQLLRRIL